jgi:MFS family permease
MLVIGLGVGMIIAGIVAIVRGRLQLSQTRAVQGVAARLLGVALLAPLPLGFLAALVYTMLNVDPNRPDQVEKWTHDHEMTLNLIIAGVELGLGLLIVIIAAVLARPLPPEGRRRRRRPADDYDDYEDDRPRRRRPADEADDFPSRRRRADPQEYEDDRPRRQRDDLDDRAR